MKFTFERATKEKARARLALIGPAGSGKTFTALAVADGLAGDGGRVAVIDTENGSARKYADRFTFDVLELDEFAPPTYVAAIGAAVAAGYDVVVVDSLSHAWIGKGGALEQVDKKAKGGNSFAAWRHVTPQHNALVDALVRCGAHLVVTMRAKTEYIIEQDRRGKSVPRKVGLAPVQRDGLEYEFDVVCDIDHDHTLSVSKSRCVELADEVIQRPGADLGERLRRWLTDGVEPTPPKPDPADDDKATVAAAAAAAVRVLSSQMEADVARARLRREADKARRERCGDGHMVEADVSAALRVICDEIEAARTADDSSEGAA